MFKIASVSGAPPQTPLGSLRRSPDPLVMRGFLPLSIAVSHFGRVIPPLPPPTKIPPPLAPQAQNPRTATESKSTSRANYRFKSTTHSTVITEMIKLKQLA